MTPADRAVIFSLVVVPGRPREGRTELVLEHFGTRDGQALGLDLLRDSVLRESGDDAEAALIVCGAFGVGPDHLAALADLVRAGWHVSHETVVSLLGRLRSQQTVAALQHAATWVPGYLEFDESRALARNAIWALGDTPGPEAESALRHLARSNHEIVAGAAKEQLDRRGAAG